MLVVGLTGGIGCGKSTIARLFAQRNVPVIDTDEIAHSLSVPPSPALEQLCHLWGMDYVDAEGHLDRTKVRQRIYADPIAKQQLEAIFHPCILQQAKAKLGQLPQDTPYALLVVPLLFETPEFRQLVGRVLVIDCPEALQIERVMQRSGLAAAEIQQIMQTQATRAQRLAIADETLVNTATMAQADQLVANLHQKYLNLSGLKD